MMLGVIAGARTPIVPPPPPGSITLVDQRQDPAGGSTTKTLVAVNFGAEDPTRVIAVLATGAGADHQVTGVTIAGNAATLGARTNTGRSAAIYFVALPTGASGDVVLTVSTTNIFVRTAILALRGVAASVFDSDTLIDTGGFGTTFNKSVDADDAGIVLGAFCGNNKNATVAWTNLAEITDLDPNGFANERHSTAGSVIDSASTVSVTAETSQTTGGSLVLVSFAGL
ncbi:MAG: hypothetical protein E5Y73_11390 [Mesorhizobium sp.]|uniref:hypothetical protein n=1 Tax=Mesorhizobium sp. TaxID=1871066 RepID=UPI001204BC3C|nr:hypothetical protein [Mesorhizobium sp.]TIL94515.1 MAG: hypothetical protein E5Y73_11390 [Mesorhizobium sp.]